MRTGKGRRELEHNVLSVQICHRFTIYSLQLLFNEDACLTKFDTRRRNVYTVPGQPQKLTHSQRTGESKVDCQTENIIVAGFQSLQKNFRCPDVSGLMFFFRQRSVFYGVSGHQFPLHRLIERITQNLVNLSDRMRCQILVTSFHILRRHSFYSKQISVILVHNSRRYILQFHITDKRTNIIGNQALSAFISRHRPCVHAVDRHIFFQKIVYGLGRGWNKGS